MSAKHLTPALVDRTVHVIDSSGVLDLACPPRQPGKPGRIGRIRDNTRLLFIGMHLCTRLGHETTLAKLKFSLELAVALTKTSAIGEGGATWTYACAVAAACKVAAACCGRVRLLSCWPVGRR